MQRSGSRVTSACRTCKQRRSKCDGARPKCHRCKELSLECAYDNVDHRKSRHSHAEFKALQSRISYLEQQVKHLQEQNSRSSILPPKEPVYSSADKDSSDHIPPSSWETLNASDDWILELPPLPWDTDKTSMVRSLLARKGSQIQYDSHSGKTVYVGPTSNCHLMTRADSSTPCEPPSSIVGEQPAIFSVHERNLVQIFRLRSHSSFPVLCGNPCAEDSALMKELISHDLLHHIVLAIGSFFLDDADSIGARDKLLDHYGQQFVLKAGLELENTSFHNVKAFLLKAYLDALRGKLESATVYNSVACAMAKRLGLHVACSTRGPLSSDSLSQPEADRLSLFWACLWLDRRLAFLEGRVGHIDRVDISSPLPLESLRRRAEFPDLPLALDLIYACSIELYCIQDVAVNKLYRFAEDIAKQDAISDGHLKFISWFASLPGAMKDISKGKTFHPSFLTFHLSFHSGLIFLHRRSLGDDGETAELSNRRCEDSAAAITSLIRTYQTLFPETPADPMVLHAAFTSALVHLALLLQPDIVTYRSALKALRATKQALLRFACSSPPAARILMDLQAFAVRWEISPANSPSFWSPDSQLLASGNDYSNDDLSPATFS